jgi:hypothetical protein
VDLHKNQSTEPVQEKDDLTAQVLHWARDRTEALEESSAASELKSPQEASQEMSVEVPPELNLRKNQDTEPVKEKNDLTAQVLDWARDRTEALEGGNETSAVKPYPETTQETPQKEPQERNPGVSPSVIVVALHEGKDNCGEAHLFEDLQTAGRFVETLVEDGLDQQRLTVFNCTQLNVHLTYRAVVHLKASEAQEEPDA